MKKPIFALFLTFTILITACNTLTNTFGSGKSTSKPSDINVFVGTQGLTAEFAKTAPPPRVFENSKFPIFLKIRNSGAYSITSDKVSPGGVLSIGREKDYIPIISLEKNNRVTEGRTDNEISFYIDGKTKINPKGDEITVTLNAETGKLEPQSENKQSTVTATLCYPYKTILSTTVCIDPDVAGIRPGKKVCNVKELVFSNGQGAPIAITKIEQNMVPEGDYIKPQFLIFIENKGKGNPVNIVGYPNACRESDFYSKDTWNVAVLRAYTSGKKEESQLVCCPNKDGSCPDKESDQKNPEKITGFIRLKDKKDFVRCTFRDGISRNSNAFTSPLSVEIDYGYVQTASATFIIQKPLRY